MTGKAWERRADESAKAYESFVAYREMGTERSLRKVQTQGNKGATKGQQVKGNISRWAKRHEWQVRVRAYDERIANAQADDEVDAVVKANRRHITELQQLQGAALRMLSPVIAYLEKFDPVKNLNPEILEKEDLPEWMRALSVLTRAIDAERKCMGLDQQGASVSVGVQVNVDDRQIILATKLYPKAVSMLTDAQRAELHRYEAAIENLGRVSA